MSGTNSTKNGLTADEICRILEKVSNFKSVKLKYRGLELEIDNTEVKPVVFQYSDGSRVPESEPASALGAGEPAPSPISKKDEFDLDDGSLIAIDPVEFERRTLEGEFNEEINDIETE